MGVDSDDVEDGDYNIFFIRCYIKFCVVQVREKWSFIACHLCLNYFWIWCNISKNASGRNYHYGSMLEKWQGMQDCIELCSTRLLRRMLLFASHLQLMTMLAKILGSLSCKLRN